MGIDALRQQVAENPTMQVTLLGSDLLGMIDQLRSGLVEELRGAMTEAVYSARADMMSGVAALNRRKPMTVNEVSDMLGVDLSTLYRWNKQGILCRQRIGGKVLYRAEDVERIIRERKGGVSVCG